MLNKRQFQIEDSGEGADLPSRFIQNTLSGFDILGAARRQIHVVAISVVVALVLGGIYLLQATPMYTSATSILIDAKKVGMTAATPLEGSLTFESGAVDSQLQILTSDKLAEAVARRLSLQNNLAFIDPPSSLIGGTIRGAIDIVQSVGRKIANIPSPPEIGDLPEPVRLMFAAQMLQSRLNVTRIGRTYVFVLEYTDRDQLLAQSIVGQYANAYLEDQLDSKFDSTRRATNWMEERIRDLKARSLAADEAVQRYRADNNLIVASGRLLDEQSLTDATTQLTAARSTLDTASARYQRLKQIIDTEDLSGSLNESMENPNVSQLRSRYLQASKLESDISARYGANHQAADKARKDMAEYERLIFEELKSLLPGYQSEVAISQARVNSIQNTISELRQTSATNDSAMVKLRALEQESESLKTLYSTFLQKFQEMQQQQSFPVTDARIISDASLPLFSSSPKVLLALLASAVLGGIVGVGIGLLREWRDRGFRTASQIRDELGLEFITNVPALPKSSTPKKTGSGGVVARKTTAEGAPERRLTLTTDSVLQKVVDEPFSQYAEAIRALKFKLNHEFPKRKGIVVGVISIFPDEGKSSIAKNLASSLALQQAKTLLIDGDLRNPSLTNDLISVPKLGLIDVVENRARLQDVIAFEEASGLGFMPGATRIRQVNDLFSTARAHELIDELRQHYDVIVIDFPPVGALTDALAANSVIDGYFFVTHWGHTPRKVVKSFVVDHPQIADKILGVVLNKVDMKRLGTYGSEYFASRYGKYGDKYFGSAT